ncbi:putative P-loop containing nucleoside triphosphate hydrolase, leucine-rich repeat domain, L [Medicago truncatula]|uniref:LRR and NB-ARC domain disease resistance protein, putative n=1 Tax=Medicago truncatula TaxID=3880 RepID=G7IWZ8_MEDTR|nr:putative disease resistance RPP13-like protein 1 [Medicago truncatula]AES69614.1 LRR and NB-ARC domain disease resistance protein, putative [Medicago truncatula]RHN66314.1 putative P-loop containing nucleoside triphosphate hydrolase, leucine-rich repeat domain, L [Medicago truncatula]
MAAALVGGAFLSASVQTLMDKLTSPEFRDYFTRTELNESLMYEMETSLLTLEVVLDDAEEKQILKPRIKQWLDRLKDAIYDAEDLLNQISYNALRCKLEKKQAINSEMEKITDQFQNLLSTTNSNGEINSEMEKICKRLQTFVQQSTAIGLQHTVSGRVSHRLPSSSVVNESVMVGRKDDKETIMNMLLSQRDTSHNNIGVVAILGMGGLGKTTLAQLVYNDKEVQQHFDLKAWVCVSEDFDIMRVTKSLLESVTSTTWDSNNLDVLRVALKKISREKRFLFVLDDLWNDNCNDWDELVSPFINGKPGSMVIITTRQQKVAEVARTFPIHELKVLSDEDCWSLLSKHALGSDEIQHNTNTALEETGRKIARKCGGLPIAAKTLGGLLRSKVDITEWTSILNNNIWNLRNDNILPALHLSYQYLPSHLKRCFAYCSIFPKDFPLDKKTLVLLWMAEGFLDCSQGGKELEELGDDCFAELLSRSLIQQLSDDARGEKFVMHDLVNDLSTFVSGKSCCRLECGDISENVRHFSYNQEYYDIFMKFEKLYNFKCLRSFLSINTTNNYNFLSSKVVDDLLPSQKRLRVLSLSWYMNITKLPDSIGNLVQLRYLDISCTKIKSLPDTTCNLYNLQTLNLSRCSSLTELPVHIGNLVSLRHLDISWTNINELPVEFGRLENLQTLTLFLVGKRHLGLSIKELRKFPNLQGKLTIKNLDNVVDAREAHDANLKGKEKIEELELIWGKQSEESQKVKVVLDMLQPPINLKSLNICLYGGTSFPSWLGNSLFSNMVSLRITNCEYCMTLPPIGQLPSLKDIEIRGMEMLETIGPEFYYAQIEKGSNSSFQPFRSLEHIKFDNMVNWNEWIPFEGIKFAFPQLKAIELWNCPELRGHLPTNLPSIEEIVISGCSHLLETPSTLHWLSSIKKMNINGLGESSQLSLLESDSPCMMQHVAIHNCSKLLAVPKLILKSTCLTHLRLYSLSSLTAFPSSGLPTSLQSLHIEKCENLSFLPPETWSNYTSLVSIDLRSSCDALTSFPLDGFPALQTLTIHNCRSLDSIYISERSSPRSSLKSLYIISHDSIELFEVKLKIDMLTALERLNLKCAELSFCEGVCLPPKLQSIEIQSKRTAPPVTEWGLQDLTALSRLSIGKGDDIVNTLMKESLLPISLVYLYIRDFDEMKSFDGNGLRHLFSLQHLFFWNCHQLETLPENCLPSSLKSLDFWDCEKLESLPEDSLPDSLMQLCIQGCPLLEERYKRKEHCSKIAHIPFKNIKGTI